MSRHVLPASLVAALPSEPGSAMTRVITHGGFEARWYAPRGTDRQVPHDRPEVYVVVRGRGIFFCNGEREPFAPSDMIWVPAGADHRFEEFTRDLAVWSIVYVPGPDRGAA